MTLGSQGQVRLLLSAPGQLMQIFVAADGATTFTEVDGERVAERRFASLTDVRGDERLRAAADRLSPFGITLPLE